MISDRCWRFQARAAPYLFLSPFALVFSIFLLYPLARSLDLSFHKTIGPGHSVFVGLANYQFLLRHDVLFGLSVLNTSAFTIAFVLVEIPLSLGLAILLNGRRVVLRSFFRFSFFSSYLVGQVFVGVLFFQILGSDGLINRLLSDVLGHRVVIPWLTSPSLILPSILIASLWLATGYGMIYFLAALQAVDPELYEAAVVDGAGRWGRFFHITLPGIRPVLLYMTLIGFIGGFQLFELPFVLLQGPGPGGRGLTIVMYLFITGFNAGDLGYASAIGWLLVVILLLISMVRFRFFRFSLESVA